MRGSFPIGWLMAAMLAGCGPSGRQMETRTVVPTEGRVLVDGKGQRGIYVTLFSDDEAQEGKPQGITDEDGRFKLETYRSDGAPPGSYTVSIAWPGQPGAGKDSASPEDRLGRRYVDPRTSGLRAVVAPPATTLPPFTLK